MFKEKLFEEYISKEKKALISGPFGSDISAKYFVDEGVPVIRGNNLSTGFVKFIDNGFAYITEEKADELNAYAICDDIVFTAVGTLGQVGIIPKESKYKKYTISNKQIRVRLDTSKLNPLYAFYWFTSPWMVDTIKARNVGSTVPLINLSIIRSLPVRVPEKINDQIIITKVLSDLDTKIELNNRINRELEAMAKTLYDYWFVQFDFPNEQGKPYKSSGGKMVYNAELKREIPVGWEVKKLGELIIKYTDKSIHIESKNILNKGKYPVITQDNGEFISGFTNEINPIEDAPLIIFGDHSCTLRYIDFSFFRGADGTQIMSFGKNLTIYVYIYLQSIIKQIPGYGKYERHYKYLKEFDVIVPESQYLKNFQLISKPIFDKISQSRLENQQLSELRDWLLPMLMNGQVTVSEL
jgi:type I restriction enzyme S subunit